MGPLAPIALFVAFALLHAAGAVDPTYNLARPLGSSVDFSVAIPKGTNYTFVVLQSTTRGEAVVLWEPGKSLRVLNPSYANRIVLLKDASAFRVHNLTLADGGDYEIVLRAPERLHDVPLRKYTLFVFHINITTEPLANSSCSLLLICKAGTGRKTRVSYSWKEQKSGITLSQGAWLSIVLHPADAQQRYTCTAQARGIQSALSVEPYECCPHSSAVTGGATRGLPFHSWISRATLAPMAVALLLLL
ncbi:uncharacterized protein LOC123019606 [Varanus komodoensis]|uniref:uncharacterized protein LOC123019606 n=1 Tax=Varanus komodoensis TaxID=61221 RepID=UPI001CF789AB|nr:uncharacterized protein LOC123019606 [Varanus komodoensis]